MAADVNENRDQLLVTALASGAGIEEAAAASKMSARTVHRRLDDKGFRRRVCDARNRIFEQTVGQLSAASVKAALTLAQLLNSDSDSIRLSAARTILEQATKLRESGELVARVSELEEMLANESEKPYKIA